jgi:hypothetical protein
MLSLLIAVGIARNAWAVVTCDPAAICPSDPCVVKRPLHLESDCDLDFTGRDVTIGPNGALIQQDFSGTSLSIEARNLWIEGSIQLTGSSEVFITLDGNLETAGSIGVPHIGIRPTPMAALYGTGLVDIVAGGDVTLEGSPISVTNGAGFVDIMGHNIDVGSQINVSGPAGEENDIEIVATGSIRTTGLMSMQGGFYPISYVTLSAPSGDIVVGGPIESQRWRNSIEMDAGGNVTLNAPISAGTEVREGGSLNVQAGGDIAVNADLDLRGFGKYVNGGSVSLFPGPMGNVSITKTIDVGGPGEIFPGGIDVGACSLRVSGRLLAGGIFLSYRNSFDATGASLRSFENSITCPCIDTNGDNVCDTGCSPAPIGLNPARVHVAPTITPFVSQPCS